MKRRLIELGATRLGVGLLLAVGLAAPAPVHHHAPGDHPSHVEVAGGCSGRSDDEHLHAAHTHPAPPCLACAIGPVTAFAPTESPGLVVPAEALAQVVPVCSPSATPRAHGLSSRGPPPSSPA